MVLRPWCLTALLLLALLAPSHAAITVVADRVTPRTAGGLATSTSFTPGPGNLLVVSAAIYNPSGCTSAVVSDAQEGAYTQVFLWTVDANSCIGQWYKNGVSAAPRTVTVNPNGSRADIEFVVSELAGQALTNVLDPASSTTAMRTSNTPQVMTPALVEGPRALIGVLTHSSATTALTPGAGWSQVTENENNSSGQAYHVQRRFGESPAGVLVDWTTPQAVTWRVGVGVYRAAVDTPLPLPTVTLAWDYLQGTDLAVQHLVARQVGCQGPFLAIGTVQPIGLGGSLQMFTDTAVAAGQTYCWQVTAMNTAGAESLPSNVVRHTVPVP